MSPALNITLACDIFCSLKDIPTHTHTHICTQSIIVFVQPDFLCEDEMNDLA